MYSNSGFGSGGSFGSGGFSSSGFGYGSSSGTGSFGYGSSLGNGGSFGPTIIIEEHFPHQTYGNVGYQTTSNGPIGMPPGSPHPQHHPAPPPGSPHPAHHQRQNSHLNEQTINGGYTGGTAEQHNHGGHSSSANPPQQAPKQPVSIAQSPQSMFHQPAPAAHHTAAPATHHAGPAPHSGGHHVSHGGGGGHRGPRR